MTDAHTEARTRAPADVGTAEHVARGTAAAVSGGARDVVGTVQDQGGQVASEVKNQARSLTAEARDRVKEQARNQNDRLAGSVRQLADELDGMARDRGDSPAGTMVAKVADGGRRVADYLAEHGPEGMLSEVQEFARRRPGAFLATALISGFVVGRLGKGIFGSDPSSDSPAGSPATGRPTVPDPVHQPSDHLTTPTFDSEATAILPPEDTSQYPGPATGQPPAGYRTPDYQTSGYPQAEQGYPSTPGYPATTPGYPTGGAHSATPWAAPGPAVPGTTAAERTTGYGDDVAVGAAPVPAENYAPPATAYPSGDRTPAEAEEIDPESVRYRPGSAP